MTYPMLPPPGYPVVRPDHPRATTSMVLGILGLVICSICAPFAWSIGGKAVKEIDASGGGAYGGRSQAQAGYVMGIIGSVLLGLTVVGVVLWLIAVIIGVASSASGP